MKKAMSRFVSMLLTCMMILSCATTAFAAEMTSLDSTVETESKAKLLSIPIVFEGIESNGIAVPYKQGDITTFKPGEVATIGNCGLTPKFRFWVTGGSSTTKVSWNVRTSGGVNYGPFGPVKADGSNYSEKSFIVVTGSGDWRFTAQVESGTNNGKLICHIQQVY